MILSNSLLRILCISTQATASMNPILKDIPMVKVEESPLYTDFSLNSFTQDIHTRHKSSGKSLNTKDNQRLQEHNEGWGDHSLDHYLPKQPDRSCDGEMPDAGYLSLGPPITTTLTPSPMENQKEHMMTGLGMEKISSKDHLSLGLSRSQGLISHIQSTSDGDHLLKDSPLKRARNEEATRIGFNQNDWRLPPNFLRMGLMTSTEMESQKLEDEAQYGSGARENVQSFPEMDITANQKIEGIDIQNFYSHIPDKMCSAAATHFTHDLIKAISSKYRHQTTSSKYPPWKDAIQIWTPKVLLPHVYFVLSCNPNLGVWEMIKKTTAFIFKTYHHWSVEEGTISDKEKLARFILWHTEVIYHIVQLGPKIKSSQDNVMGSTRDIELMAPKVSTLARMFHMLHIDFDSFTANSRGGHILERHVSETFERDYKLGYPTNKDNWTMYPSVWERWIAKSDEIRSTAEDVHWPENLDPQRSKLEPILLFNGEIENDMKIKKDPQVSEFVQHYKNELMKTMRFIKNSQSENPGFPPYTLNQFSRGIHIFLKEKLKGSSMYEIKLFSKFLHQDSKEKLFHEFWREFKISEFRRYKLTQKRRKVHIADKV